MKAPVKEAPVPEGACTNLDGVNKENTHTDSSRTLPQGGVQGTASLCCSLCSPLPSLGPVCSNLLPTQPSAPLVKVCASLTLSEPGKVAPNGLTTIWDTSIFAESVAALLASKADGETAVLGRFNFPPSGSAAPASPPRLSVLHFITSKWADCTVDISQGVPKTVYGVGQE